MINLKPLKNRVLAINYREVFLSLANEIICISWTEDIKSKVQNVKTK